MAITVKHTKVSTIPDGDDSSLIRPSDWNDDHQIVGTVPVANGGTGAATLTGYVKGNGTSTMTASSTIPNTDITGLGTASTKDAGAALGVATLDAGGTIPLSQIPASLQGGVSYQGTWNALTNTPTLSSGVGTKGYYYVVSVAGNTNLDGITSWNVGDWAIFSGTVWQKVDNTDAVTSVNGYTGTVVLTNTDISGFGTMSTQNANAVAITGGAIDGTTIGATTTSTGKFTTLNASTSLTTPIVQASNSGGLSLKNSAGTTQISMGGGGGDNVSINVATNINGANAQIDISPTGTGHVHIKPTGTGSLEIAPTNVGTIDNMTIGATTARNASVVDLSVTGTTSFDGAQGTAGQVLTSAGTGNTPTWTTPTTGTVTSVGLSAPSIFTVSGSPVTGSGTLALTYSGTALPVANGGTGVTTSTGADSVVLSTSPTITGAMNLTGSTTSNSNFGSAITSGTIIVGGTAGTGAITVGQSTVSQTTNIQAGATASGSTKTMNIGTGGLSGSTTAINIGSANGTSTTTINGSARVIGTATSFFKITPNWLNNAGVWLDLSTDGPSGIGSGGPGVNPWVAYAASGAQWFNNAIPGDICYRNITGRLLFGNSSTISAMSIASGITTIGAGANNIQIAGAATTVAPSISAVGTDTNIDILLTPKGTGTVRIPSGISGGTF